MSLFPYRYAAAQEASKTGMPIMRALVLNYQNDDRARQMKDEYLFGPDLIIAPILDQTNRRVVYLPTGDWVDYWTGAHISGGTSIVVDVSADSIPVYVRAGAIIPKIPEDVMTLVPLSESGNRTVKSLDNRRVYEIIDGGTASVTDFEGRKIDRGVGFVKITGDSTAHMIVRWRFGHPQEVTVNGESVHLEAAANGEPFVEFDHLKESTVQWH
jgi:alpha-D-xyloside xylohydrolase